MIFWGNILVEAHGMLFDLLVIGVFILWLNRLGERRQTIQRYREEIEDYLGWNEKEATYRIVGNIRRLNRESVSDIALSQAYLQGAKLGGADLHKADLWGANLHGAILLATDLCEADLIGANLRGANLHGAGLRGAKLGGARYNDETIWPDGFDPEAAGAIKDDD